jgi:hypothetical protein
MGKNNDSKKNVKQATKQAKFISIDNFEKERFSTTELQDPDKKFSTTQYQAFPRYNHNKGGESTPVYKTDWIRMTQYGLPQINEQYKIYTDSDRNYVKIPLDPNQESCQVLEEKLSGVDEYMEENRKEFFKPLNKVDPLQKKSKKKINFSKLYNYSPLVKTPQGMSVVAEDSESDDENLSSDDEGASDNEVEATTEETREKYKSTKARLDVDWESKNVVTVVYVQDDREGTNRRRVSVNNATDLEQYLRWNSEVRFVIMMNKVWAGKSEMAGTKMRGYGISQKIKQMLIIPSEFKTKVNYQDCAFDSDTDEDSDNESDNEAESDDENASEEEEVSEEEEDDE